MPLNGWADEMKRRIHNGDIKIKRLEREMARALRALRSNRATLRYERARGAETVEVLSSLVKLCRSGRDPSPGFVVMHCKAAASKLGREIP